MLIDIFARWIGAYTFHDKLLKVILQNKIINFCDSANIKHLKGNGDYALQLANFQVNKSFQNSLQMMCKFSTSMLINNYNYYDLIIM